ncbi:MAG: extensin family protein [Hyphomonadaceae bacterium]
MTVPPIRAKGPLHRVWSHTWRWALAAFSALFVVLFITTLPPQNSPLGDVNLDQPVGVFTGLKLSRIRDDPALCRRLIRDSKLKASPLPNEQKGFCVLQNALALDMSYYPYSQPVKVSCPMAAAIYVWEREVVAQAAARRLNSAIVEVVQAGSYSCRRINGTSRPSEHASANAMDVRGFKLADGSYVSVEKAWRAGGEEAAFLRDVRDGGCKVFQAVLSPDYNADHRDHLHFDMGRYKLCR